MKSIVGIILALTLVGCNRATATHYDIYRAYHFCKGLDGIVSIEKSWLTCKDGRAAWIGNIIIKEEEGK